MAFMTAPSTSGGGERLPILKFDARAGRLFTIDRTQLPDGTWQTQQTDVTMAQPVFCVDFGTLEVGWAHFAAGGPPMWALAWYGQPQPGRPPSPGNDDQNRPVQFKAAFRVKVAGQGIGGVREFGGNSAALISGMNDLHTRFEGTAQAQAGQIPLVRLATTQAVKSGQSTNYVPVFEITGWVDRPKVLGDRMVPAGAQMPTVMTAAPIPSPIQVPPPVPSPRASTPVSPPPRPAPAPALVNDEMPF